MVPQFKHPTRLSAVRAEPASDPLCPLVSLPPQTLKNLNILQIHRFIKQYKYGRIEIHWVFHENMESHLTEWRKTLYASYKESKTMRSMSLFSPFNFTKSLNKMCKVAHVSEPKKDTQKRTTKIVYHFKNTKNYSEPTKAKIYHT